MASSRAKALELNGQEVGVLVTQDAGGKVQKPQMFYTFWWVLCLLPLASFLCVSRLKNGAERIREAHQGGREQMVWNSGLRALPCA
jgi:hypothetical protein